MLKRFYENSKKAVCSVPLRLFLSFVGPGFMVGVGYVDPGNYATGLSSGSRFGYSLLFVVWLSNLMAICLQHLCIKLGVVTSKDLAENCRAHFHPFLNGFLYILAEISIIATDMAELIGTAVALKLLFGLKLSWGILLTGLDVLLILLGFHSKRLRAFELLIALLVMTVAICFILLIVKVNPEWDKVGLGLLPIVTVFKDPEAVYLALGIMGATVMPHNLYLHSNIVKYRSPLGQVQEPKAITSFKDVYEIQNMKSMIYFMTVDLILALSMALFVNASIVIVAAAAFQTSQVQVSSLEQAFNLLSSTIGPASGVIFAISLFCAGQSSTITGTLAGQVVMQGFLGPKFKIPPWARRLITRSLAILPALLVSLLVGDEGISNLLVLSQVILSAQLPFAVWPLLYFTNSPKIMSIPFEDPETLLVDSEKTADFTNSTIFKVITLIIALVITGMNIYLLSTINH